MNNISALIRQRGQLTIPASIRDRFSWLQDSMAVLISVSGSDSVVIKPHTAVFATNWSKLRRNIAKTRRFSGRRGNLSKFIAQDRLGH